MWRENPGGYRLPIQDDDTAIRVYLDLCEDYNKNKETAEIEARMAVQSAEVSRHQTRRPSQSPKLSQPGVASCSSKVPKYPAIPHFQGFDPQHVAMLPNARGQNQLPQMLPQNSPKYPWTATPPCEVPQPLANRLSHSPTTFRLEMARHVSMIHQTQKQPKAINVPHHQGQFNPHAQMAAQPPVVQQYQGQQSSQSPLNPHSHMVPMPQMDRQSYRALYHNGMPGPWTMQ